MGILNLIAKSEHKRWDKTKVRWGSPSEKDSQKIVQIMHVYFLMNRNHFHHVLSPKCKDIGEMISMFKRKYLFDFSGFYKILKDKELLCKERKAMATLHS